MKALTILLTAGLLAFSVSAQVENKEMRSDIDKDIPLTEAIRRANEQFPDAQPLTEEEVVAAVQAIKLTHPDIKKDIYVAYMRVVKERVLPKNMYFSQITSWNTQYGAFRVDWKDLTLRGRAATAEESKAVLSKLPGTVSVGGPIRVGGFGYRIRARFVSSQPPIEGGARATERSAPGVEQGAAPNATPTRR
jgi:hypothetical protein